MAELQSGHAIGPWVIEKVLGSGSFGITYLAHHHTTELRAFKKAIKECYPSGVVARRDNGSVSVTARSRALFEEELRYFREEAQALARIAHRNVVKMTDFIETNGTCYLITDYVPGPTLRQRVGNPRSGRPNLLTCVQTRALLTTLLDALETVHVHLIHRDIDPQNVVLVDQYNEPVLIDFGAARTLSAARSHTLTAILKHGYAPYEQYTLSDDECAEEFGEAPAVLTGQLPAQGPWTDLYALAATCHFALTGKAPPNALNRKLGLSEYVPLAGRIDGDPALLRSIDKALSIEPCDRFQSAAEWKASLAATAPMPLPRLRSPEPAAKFGKPLAQLLAAVLVALLLLGGGYGWKMDWFKQAGIPAKAALAPLADHPVSAAEPSQVPVETMLPTPSQSVKQTEPMVEPKKPPRWTDKPRDPSPSLRTPDNKRTTPCEVGDHSVPGC